LVGLKWGYPTQKDLPFLVNKLNYFLTAYLNILSNLLYLYQYWYYQNISIQW